MTIRENFLSERPVSYGTRNAWAAYVRRRWPQNTQAMCEREWGLTPGRANALVFAKPSLATIDHIKAHPRGGVRVSLEVEAIFWGLSLDAFLSAFIEQEKLRLEGEERRARADRERLAAMGRRLGPLLGLADHGAPGVGAGGSGKRPAEDRQLGSD